VSAEVGCSRSTYVAIETFAGVHETIRDQVIRVADRVKFASFVTFSPGYRIDDVGRGRLSQKKRCDQRIPAPRVAGSNH